MCDYSLHSVASRPAKVGDKLVTTEFWNTTTRGLAPVGEPTLAVCLLPGTEIAFESDVLREPTGFQLSLFKRPPEPIPHKVARFRQINLNHPCTHHDALEFPDGQIVLLTHLREGQRATVLQLPVQANAQSETAARGADSRDREAGLTKIQRLADAQRLRVRATRVMGQADGALPVRSP